MKFVCVSVWNVTEVGCLGWDILEMHNLCTVYMWAMEKGVGGTRLAMHHLCQTQLLVCHTPDSCRDFLVPDCYARSSGKRSVETACLLQKDKFWNLSFHFHSNGSVCGALMGCKFGFKALPQDLLQFPYRQWLDAQVNTFLRTIGLQDWQNALFLLRDEFKGQWTRMGAIWALLFLWQ